MKKTVLVVLISITMIIALVPCGSYSLSGDTPLDDESQEDFSSYNNGAVEYDPSMIDEYSEELETTMMDNEDDVDPGVEETEDELTTESFGDESGLGIPDEGEYEETEDSTTEETIYENSGLAIDLPEDDEDNEVGYEESEDLDEEPGEDNPGDGEDNPGDDEEMPGGSGSLGASGATLKAPAGITVGKDETIKLKLSHTGKAKKYTFKVADKSVCTGSFDKNNSSIINVKGMKTGGSTYITVKLKGGFLNLETLDKKNVRVDVPKMAASKTSVSVPKGSAKSIKFSYSNCSQPVKMKWSSKNTSLFKASWSKWKNHNVTLTIKGKKVGSTKVKVVLYNYKTGDIYGSKTVSLSVQSPPTVKLSKSKVSVLEGNKDTVKVTYGNLKEHAYYSVGNTNKSAYSLSWGGTSGKTKELQVKGMKKGKGTVTVYLKSSEDNNVLAKASFTVNVSANPKVTLSKSSLSVNTGSAVSIKCTASGVSGDYQFKLNKSKTPSSAATFYNVKKKSADLKITGLNAGTDTYTVSIKKSGKIIASAKVTVTINLASVPSVKLNNTNVSVTKGRSNQVKATLRNMPKGKRGIRVSFSNSSLCKYNVDMSVIDPIITFGGLKTGTTSFKVSVVRSSDNKVLATASGTVQVKAPDKFPSVSYSFPNYGQNASKAICKRMYIKQHWRAVYEAEYGRGGNCFGMSTTAGTIFAPNNIYANSFGGKSSIRKLSKSDKNSSWGWSLNQWIRAMQITYVSTDCQRIQVRNGADIESLASRVRSDGASNKPVAVVMFNKKGGHAVLAYGIETVDSSKDRLLIYDSYSPNCATTQSLYLYKSNNAYTGKWSYQPNGKEWFNSGAARAELIYVPYSSYKSLWDKRGSLVSSNEPSPNCGALNEDVVDRNMISLNSGDVTIRDVEDNLIAKIEEGELVSGQNVVELIRIPETCEGFEEESPRYVLYMPVDVYSFTNNDSSIETFRVTDANLELSTSVETLGNEITICADDSYDFASTVLNPEQDEEYKVSLGCSYEGGEEELEFEGVGTGDTISVMLNDGGLEMCNMESASLSISGDSEGELSEQIFIVEATAGNHGTITPEGNDPVWQGENQEYVITPSAGYKVKDVVVDGKSVGAVSKYKFTDVQDNHSIHASFELEEAISISKAKVSKMKNCTYTGKSITRNPSVLLNGVRLKKGTDYTVKFTNNKNVGTAKATFAGKGKYAGKISATFKINPKGTSIKKIKRGKKKMTVKWKRQAKQTTGYQIRYSLKKNFKSGVKTVTVKGPKTTKKVIKKLKAKKTYYVQVRTYKTVSGKKYYSAWSKVKYVKTK